MALARWSPLFSVGVDLFDAQHKRWLDLANNLHDAVASGHGNQEVGRVLREMLEYTRTHFADEEAELARAGYPGLVAHRAEHQLFVGRMNRLVTAYTQGTGDAPQETMTALREWLVEHVMTADRDYTSHLLAFAQQGQARS